MKVSRPFGQRVGLAKGYSSAIRNAFTVEIQGVVSEFIAVA
jgi:hypothetical protein